LIQAFRGLVSPDALQEGSETGIEYLPVEIYGFGVEIRYLPGGDGTDTDADLRG